MQQAKQMHAERDTIPLDGWTVAYRFASATCPRLVSGVTEQDARDIAAVMLDSRDCEIIAVFPSERLYDLNADGIGG